MACESEQRALQNANTDVDALENQCLAEQMDDDPGLGLCRSLLRQARARQGVAQAALAACWAEQEATRAVQSREGFVTFLRVHDLGGGAGGGETNHIDVEVVFRLSSEPGRAFGFQLRQDEELPARQGMLDVLRDALVHDIRVTVDFSEKVIPPNQNSTAFRIMLSKPRTFQQDAVLTE